MRKKTHNRRFLRMAACLLFLLALMPVTRAQGTDSVTVIFRFLPGKDMFLSPYGSNAPELERLLDFIERHREDIEKGGMPLRVDGYCNSARSEKAGLAVAKTRSNRVKSEMITRKGLSEDNFITRNHATDGDFVTVRVTLPKENVSVTDDKGHVNGEETAQLRPENGTFTEATRNAEETKPSTVQEKTDEPVISATPTTSTTPNLSLRANLLRWATLTPDLGLEWRINRDWGILVNGTWTSWSWNDGDRRYALWEVAPEVRYYLGSEKRGYLGAMYKAGEFNYKLGTTGRQGDLMGGGITGGYMLRLNNALSLDFSLGVGYLRADYDKYVLIDGVRVKRGSETKNWWGPVSAGVTLVWNIFQ